MKLKTDYRIPQESIAAVKPEERPSVVVDGLIRDLAVCSKAQRSALFRRLTPGQRAFVVLNGLVAEIYNGGILQYYWNSTGDDASAALDALKLIQATKYVPIFRASMRLFANASVLKNRRLRQSMLKKIDADDTYKRFEEPFYVINDNKRTSLLSLQLAYLKRHPDDFFRPTGSTPPTAGVGKPEQCDYRVARSRAIKLGGEALHWELIEKIWDDYWDALKSGREHAQAFIANLSPGQRSLIAIDILNKNVLRFGGFQQFMATQVGSDILVDEVAMGYRLLKAKPYIKLFALAAKLSGDTPALARMSSEKFRQRQEVERRAGEKAAENLKAESRDLFMVLQKRKKELATVWDELTDDFIKLIESPETKIERCIEAYVAAHPDEFFKP